MPDTKDFAAITKATSVPEDVIIAALVQNHAESVEVARKQFAEAVRAGTGVFATAARERWNELSLQVLERASTFTDVHDVYTNAPRKSVASWMALQKLLSLCTTLRQAIIVYATMQGDAEEERFVIRKIYELFPESEIVEV